MTALGRELASTLIRLIGGIGLEADALGASCTWRLLPESRGSLYALERTMAEMGELT
jgi:hypothetical protein